MKVVEAIYQHMKAHDGLTVKAIKADKLDEDTVALIEDFAKIDSASRIIDEFIVKNPNGELTDSITCDFRLKIPSLLDDGNILHQDLSDKLFTMIITNNQSIKILK